MTGDYSKRFKMSGSRKKGLVIAAISLLGCSFFAYLRFVADSLLGLPVMLSLMVVVLSSTSLLWGILIVGTDEWRPLTPVRAAIVPFVTVVSVLLPVAFIEGAIVYSHFGGAGSMVDAAVATLRLSNIEWIVAAALFPILGSALRQRSRPAIVGAFALTLLAFSQLRYNWVEGASYGYLLAVFAVIGGIGPGLLGYYATEPAETADGNPSPSGDEPGGAESNA